MKTPPKLTLQVGGKMLQITVTKAIWGVWRVATYPLAITAGYMLFGTEGAIYTGLLLGLMNRGQI